MIPSETRVSNFSHEYKYLVDVINFPSLLWVSENPRSSTDSGPRVLMATAAFSQRSFDWLMRL